MPSQRLEILFYRHCQETITEDERKELSLLLLQDENREQINRLIDQFVREDHVTNRLSTETAEDILNSIFSATTRPAATEDWHNETLANESETPPRSLWALRLAAAAVALLIVYGGYSWLNQRKQIVAPVAMTSTYGEDVPAGGNKAQLTLTNGQTFDLATITDGNLHSQPGTTINKVKGEITYQDSTYSSGSTGYNVLTTPLGGQYKIVLPDGSKAWLNAGSSLKYPTAFHGKTRHVEMTGEVYFEVEPDKNKPFLVKVIDRQSKDGDMEIIVLGTHFNISSYGDEPTIETTLLEGSVRVKKNDLTKLLRPGQQARVPAGQPAQDIAVETVDTETAVAWKEGRFEFNGNIRDIMRQISRWYDLDVRYEGNVEKKSFAGTISRKNNVSEVLKMLELTGGIQFRIEDRKITVRNTD